MNAQSITIPNQMSLHQSFLLRCVFHSVCGKIYGDVNRGLPHQSHPTTSPPTIFTSFNNSFLSSTRSDSFLGERREGSNPSRGQASRQMCRRITTSLHRLRFQRQQRDRDLEVCFVLKSNVCDIDFEMMRFLSFQSLWRCR